MSKKLGIRILAVIALVLVSAPSMAFGAMADYCQVPPFVSNVVPPNIMLAVDVSGSMGWSAYTEEREGEHRRYCSLNALRECEHDSDCQHDGHDWGTCVTSTSTTLPYGYCSNALTTACTLSSECTALPSCTTPPCTCVPRQAYEGYFRPDRDYFLDATDSTYYEESGLTCQTYYTYLCNTSSSSGCSATKPANSLTTCDSGRFYCSRGSQTYNYQCQASSTGCTNATTTRPANAFNSCTPGQYYCTNRRSSVPTSTTTGDCGSEKSGNLLNFQNMTRIDLLRWAMTGGRPKSCGTSGTTPNDCDPREWNSSGNSTKIGSACSNTQKINTTNSVQGGCVLQAHNNTKVAVPWSRVRDGLAFQFADLSVKPRMGAMFYEGTLVKSNYVYVGDFTGPNSTSNFTFQNLLTQVNATNPGGTTPTGPALWDVYHYFSQTSPEYGGIPPQVGSGDMWKDPMYDCPDQGGSNCKFIPCSKNFVLLMSDGLWNQGGGPPASASCSINDGFEIHSADPVVPSYKMHMGFTNAAAEGTPATKVSGVYTVGLFVSVEGQKALENTALYGSFDNSSKTWPSNRTNYPGRQTGDPSNCPVNASVCTQGTGSNCNAVPASSPDWDKNADGVADTFFYADNALAIRNKVLEAVLDMLSQVASGTGASVLASGEGSGANLIQAIFYPRYSTPNGSVLWTGTLQNFWYYIDPFFAKNSIREETNADSKLNLSSDRIVQFFYDSTANPPKTRAKLYADSNGDGLPDSPTPSATVDIENIGHLWEAGSQLRDRNLSADARRIYTSTTGAANSQVDFSTANVARTFLDVATDPEAANVINWVKGYDIANYRLRTTTGSITLDGTNVWKLGDIVHSTAKIASWVPLNTYDSTYGDLTYKEYMNSSAYAGRGMVFAGANDGMLHALKLGKLEFPGRTGNTCTFGTGDLACLADPGSNRGKEAWAFIPKNVLPYLKYMADPDYCHLYSVDLTPFIFDASIGGAAGATKTASSWRTVLIGGMRTGGACRELGSTCTDCVKTPVAGAGYSSYFALDITDTLAAPDDPTVRPVLLWEYSNAQMGFATTGPQVLRIGDGAMNGNWYVVFGSGPTGPTSGAPNYTFYARSDQNLKLFVLDLRTGSLLKTIDTSIPNAFAGTMYTGGMDVDLDYQDEVFYVGYVKATGGSWTDGGVLRVLTGKTTPDVAGAWEPSTVLDGIGPITTSIAKLLNQHRYELWLYFGTGRYFYVGDDPGPTSRTDATIRKVYGIKDPCYTSGGFSASCPSMGSLTDATNDAGLTSVTNGWYIRLEPADSTSTGYYAERSVTSPGATTSGVVFFTTYKPGKDICSVGGKPYFWATKYDTGGAAGTLLRGKALVQISTGAIEQVDLSSAFSEQSARRADVQFATGDTGGPGGMPGGDPPPIFTSHKPEKKIMHIKER